MYKLICFFFVMMITTSSNEAKIISTDNIIEIEYELSEVDSRTLVVFDYEDVLVGTIDNLFSIESQVIEHNFYNYGNLLPKIILAHDFKVYNLMNNKWPQLIQRIQALGAKPILLTRGIKKIALGDIKNEFLETISSGRQIGLLSFNIDFKKSWTFLDKIEFPEIPISYTPSNIYSYNPFFNNGMIFCGGYEKGPVLLAFLSKNPDIIITKIIFIDNKMQNLKSVEKAANTLGINFIGIEYTISHTKKSHNINNKRKEKRGKNYMDNLLIINKFIHAQ